MSSLAHRLYHDEMRFCGCGSPEVVLGLLRDFLFNVALCSDIELRVGSTLHPQAQAARVSFETAFDPQDARTFLVLYLLQSLELIECGSSPAQSYLTAKGCELLAFLGTVSEEDWMRDNDGLDISCMQEFHDLVPLVTILPAVGMALLDETDTTEPDVLPARAQAMRVVAARLKRHEDSILTVVPEIESGRGIDDIRDDLLISACLLRDVGNVQGAVLAEDGVAVTRWWL